MPEGLIRIVGDWWRGFLTGRGRTARWRLIDAARLTEELAPCQDLNGDQFRLDLGPIQVPADLLTCRPEDRCIGTAHWVQFTLDASARALLADFRQPARFVVTLPTYPHDSGYLSDEVRQSLLDDLALSDRDGDQLRKVG